MRSTIVLFLFFTQIAIGVAQTESDFISIQAHVFDELSHDTLSFATIYNKSQFAGTASNLHGYFELPNNRVGDTVVVSHLGYKDKVLVIVQDLPERIGLTPFSSSLEEIEVVAASDYLYDMIARVKKSRKTESKKAKTYFFLETLYQDESIEIIESYYNGEYSNLGIDELHIKKGRIGLKPIGGNRYFSSRESSRLFTMHDLWAKSKWFPDSPLSIGKRELKKAYTLSLNHIFHEGQQKFM